MRRWVWVVTVGLVFVGGTASGEVVINEIHYDSEDNTSHEEFVELLNAGTEAVDVSGWYFSEGIDFSFAAGTVIPAGEFVVVAQDPEALGGALGYRDALGPFAGRLSGDGERVVLRDSAGAVVDQVDYLAEFPWPLSAGGEGASMELIHPALDNDLGGSWRPSGLVDIEPREREYYLRAQSSKWRWRKATSEPAGAPGAWTELDYAEDVSWQTGQTSIGMGDDDDNTIVDDMRTNYTGLYLRHRFTVPAGAEIPGDLILSLFVDDGAVVWINGVEVARVRVDEGAPPPFDGRANRSDEADFEDVWLPNPGAYLAPGENVIAIHALNITPNSNDFSIDAELLVPGSDDLADRRTAPPTPGASNTVFSESAPPQVRQVDHEPRQPAAGEQAVVTVKVTDPDGVAAVRLLYQTVAPGAYIPALLPVPLATLLTDAFAARPANPDFEDPANWTSIDMVDGGGGADAQADDDVYTAAVPAQANRVLVRYRIEVRDGAGISLRVPYEDDPSLNFAYFVYDGVPDYRASTSILGEPTTHPADALASVPVYMLVSRERDVLECVAASTSQQISQGLQARFAENWEGTFVYDGFVYDHVQYRLRGANGRYQVPPGNPGGTAGKRHWRFKFNKGGYLRARDKWGDRYPTRWRILNTGRMFGNRLDGNWGLNDQVNDVIWRAYGVPAAFGHAFHFRVIDDEEEAPTGAGGQYLGDFWGLARAFENYDVRFLEAHGLEKGNVYKLVNQTKNALEQRRYQAPDAVADGSDHDNIEGNLRAARTEEWLLAHVDYTKWFQYHSIAQAIRHYDYWPDANKNSTWYFEPVYEEANGYFGRMWTLPFDADATWGPTWNQGQDRPWDAIHSSPAKPSLQMQYRNHIREVRDLLWQEDQLQTVIRQTAAFMDPLEEADIDRWRGGPAAAGRQYFASAREGKLEGKAVDMIRFAFTGGSWPGGSVPAGGRAAFLDSSADSRERSRLPAQPTATYVGPEGFPLDGLVFETSAFTDPNGNDTFGAVKWRLAEVSAMADPGSVPLADPVWKAAPAPLEVDTVWEMERVDGSEARVTIPPEVVLPGRTYRVRVRMTDDTALTSHWSAAVEFVAGDPSSAIPQVDGLRVTELMFRPEGGSDFEFIELENISGADLDLRGVRFSEGIEFDFAGSAVETLSAGERVVAVRDLATFSRRYDVEAIALAGEYSGKLANDGETITLVYGAGLVVQSFAFDDAWYPETDGGGHSLNVVDPSIAPAEWSLPEGWFPSTALHGSPGTADGQTPGGRVRPGDASLDGALQITDAIQVLQFLFGGAGDRPPPCGGATVADGGNVPLLDFDGGGSVDITDAVGFLGYLFGGGGPHALGVDCVTIEGCPSACE